MQAALPQGQARLRPSPARPCETATAPHPVDTGPSDEDRRSGQALAMSFSEKAEALHVDDSLLLPTRGEKGASKSAPAIAQEE